MARHFDRTYGPTVRLLSSASERIHQSYATGKQREAWALVWKRFEDAEGLKLWARMVGQLRVMSSKDADKKDDTGRGRDNES